MPNNETNQLITTTKLGRFKNKLPSWVGTRAEHTAAEEAGTLPTNGIIGISDEEGSGGGGGGGNARSKIFKNVTVYKSSDFEKISDGTNTYPCVHFQGKSSGKIIMIKIVDEPAPTLSMGVVLSNVYHYGGNLSDGVLRRASDGNISSSWTYNGITCTKLPEGGIKVSGTSTVNCAVRIGDLVVGCPAELAGTIKCYSLSGDYDGLKFGVASSYKDTYYNNTACPLDEEAEWSTLLGTQTDYKTRLMLYVPKGKTFDCEFYPMVCGKWAENDHYERPFSVNSLGFLRYSAADNMAALTSTVAYFREMTSRTAYRYSVDYPVVHEGENTFVLRSTSYANYNFEVYYTEDNTERAELGGYLTTDLDSEYEYAKDLILQQKHLLPMATGSVTQEEAEAYFRVSEVHFTKQSSVLPTLIYYGAIATKSNDGYIRGYSFQRRDVSGSVYKVLKAENFSFDSYYNERLRIPYGSSVAVDTPIYYGLACDYSGFDDSTTIT